MLPFLRACSRLDDSALDIRRLPDQCWAVLDQIQRSWARCDAVVPWSAVPFPRQMHHTSPKSSTVVHRWIGTCIVTEELKAGGTDDVCLVADHYVGRPPVNRNHTVPSAPLLTCRGSCLWKLIMSCVACNRYWRGSWTCLRTWRMKHEPCWRKWVYLGSWSWLPASFNSIC